MFDLQKDRRRLLEGCLPLLPLLVAIVGLVMAASMWAYSEGVRVLRVTPTVLPTPRHNEMTIWIDGVEWYCQWRESEWICDETGRTKEDE